MHHGRFTWDRLNTIKRLETQGDMETASEGTRPCWPAFLMVSTASAVFATGNRASTQQVVVNAPTAAAKAVAMPTSYSHESMNDLEWAVLLGGAAVTRDVCETVPPVLRPVVPKAARGAGRALREQTHSGTPRDIAAMAKPGPVMVHGDRAEEELWLQAVQGPYPTPRGRSVPPKAFDDGMVCREVCRRMTTAGEIH